ncbi:MAG: alpha/beta hydrolase [Ignavibacteriales bacterium]|nr:alpha/beta hydrolase [Ignavibacteriales bacterium]
MAQDPSLNNLVDPPGNKAADIGSLGNVIKSGKGTQPMILIPGIGFSGNIYKEFMASIENDFRMYAVTLPGFGGTPAPPGPGEETSFGEQTWTNNAVVAIEKLMERENIRNPVVVGHWQIGTQIALRLALKHPKKIKAVVLLSGVAKMDVTGTRFEQYYATPEARVAPIDTFLAPKWFKTVTRETWDDNNFLPEDYTVHPRLGLRYWREAALPKLHVWVRYLCEFNAQDITVDLSKLKVPTLLLKPGLEGIYAQGPQNYIEMFCHDSWGNLDSYSSIKVKTIPHTRSLMWLDRPEEVKQAVIEFLRSAK